MAHRARRARPRVFHDAHVQCRAEREDRARGRSPRVARLTGETGKTTDPGGFIPSGRGFTPPHDSAKNAGVAVGTRSASARCVKYGLTLGVALLATVNSACTEPSDQLLLEAPDATAALGSEIRISVARGTNNGPLCGRARTANIHILGPDLSDCRLGNDVLSILEAKCDDDACTREDKETTASTLRIRPRKAGKVTFRVRARARSD